MTKKEVECLIEAHLANIIFRLRLKQLWKIYQKQQEKITKLLQDKDG